MSFSFYLSYAPTDYCEDLQRFFDDLRATVGIRLQKINSDEVGFFDAEASETNAEWRPDVAEALRASQMMIALTSENYLRSERAGKEWGAFQQRQRLASTGSSTFIDGTITPVVWSRSAAATDVIGENGLGHSNQPYRERGLQVLRKSIVEFQADYASLLSELTEHIAMVNQAGTLPALPVAPDFASVQNVFKPAFRAVIVESDNHVRKLVVDMLTPQGFEVLDYEQPADLQRDLQGKLATERVDLFVIDLGFGRREEREALNLIYTIKLTRTKSGLMAMSANWSNENRLEARRNGAEDLLAKPFLGDIRLTADRMVRLAETGKDRRLFMSGVRQNSSKRKRPIFLSYATRDNDHDNIAIYLKSQIEAIPIGVWYSPEMQPPEDPEGPKRAFDGIAEARLFLPLITPEYLSSIPCISELITFLVYQTKNPTLKLMPVLTDAVDRLENFHWIKPLIGEHRYLRADRFDNDLTAILGWIQNNVNGNSL
jgi:DNA-binding response OmpR family regulator